MFRSSNLFGNYVPLISLGAITSTVLEVRINPIFDKFTNRVGFGSVKKEHKRYHCDCGTAQHNATTATILVLLHFTPQNHGMADTRVAILKVAWARERSLG
jgi:hypothetical protein